MESHINGFFNPDYRRSGYYTAYGVPHNVPLRSTVSYRQTPCGIGRLPHTPLLGIVIVSAFLAGYHLGRLVSE